MVERVLLKGFSAILVLLVLLGGVFWHSANKSAEATRWVVHTHEVLGKLDHAMDEIFRAEAAQRGYLLWGTENYLSMRDLALAGADDALNQVAALVGDNAVQQARLVTIRQQFAQRMIIARRSQETRAREGLIAVSQGVSAGPEILNQMQEGVKQMADEERRLLSERKAREASQIQLTHAALSVLVVVLFSVLCYLFWLIRRDNLLRNLASAALQQSETLLKQILDVLPVAVFVADAKGTLTMINPATHKLWAGAPYVGIDRYGEYKGRYLDTGKEIAADEWALALAVTKGQTTVDVEIEIECFDQSRKIILLNGVPLRDAENRITGGIAVCQDITDIKRSEQQLRAAAHFDETRNKALALFNASFDRKTIYEGVLALLADKHPFPVSALYSHDDWCGKFVCEAAWALPAGMAREFAFGEGLLGQAALAGRTIVLNVATELPQLSMQTGLFDCPPTQVLIIPVAHQERPIAVLVLAATRIVDDSTIAFLESLGAQLGVALHNLKLYDDTKLLADQLSTRSEEILRKNSELERASKMKSEFLANMSHELRTPLNAIIGFSELLKDGMVGELSDEQGEYVSEIFGSGQHLLELINDVLDLSKVEAGKMMLEVEPVEIHALLANGLSIVKEAAFARQVQLSLDIGADVGTVHLDLRKAKQMIYNLLSNAVKFSHAGGHVDVCVSRVRREVVGIISAPAGRSFPLTESAFTEFIEIRISDNGIGISEIGLDQLFQPFSQVDGGLARRFEGTGLGLAMVRRLAELHGGTVAVETAVGQGSSFIVWLPLGQAGAAASNCCRNDCASLPGNTLASGEDRWALVVEDNDGAAELIRRHLEAEGLRVIRSATAENALELATTQRLALITLDIMLPGMDGWDFLSRIREVPELNRIPVLIISIMADTKRGMSLGATAVLEKPVSHIQLHGALTDLGLDSSPSRTIKTLVVDDDPRAVGIIASHLPQPEYEVLCAYGGQEAIEAALRHLPDLIVLDLMMPEISGFDVVERLKQYPDTARIPILVLTAKHITADDRSVLNGHILKIVEKSEFDQGDLLNEVRRALAGQDRS